MTAVLTLLFETELLTVKQAAWGVGEATSSRGDMPSLAALQGDFPIPDAASRD